ncbi:MAG: hypothetical protein JNL11_13025 [Bdellovibrionaceae bacterium]|nr:hypothetical protein [Pseudobdellovibrionaceae bacterium]
MKKFFVVFFISLSLWASLDNTTKTTGSVSSALGGAGRAAVAPGDVSTLNPANLAHLRGYYLYSRYLPGESAYAISDNTAETVVPASVYYYQNSQERNFKLSFAEKIRKRIAVGISGSFYQFRNTEQSANRMNMDFGVSYVPRDNLGFGFVAYNLIGAASNELIRERTAPQIGMGSHYMYRGFLRLRADYVTGNNYKISDGQIMVGAENYINRWMIFRMGYQENLNENRDLGTLGWGFDLPKFKLNYAYLTETGSEPEVRHSVDLSIPF